MNKDDKKSVIASLEAITNGGKVAYIEVVILNYDKQERAEAYLKKPNKKHTEIITKHMKSMYEELAKTFEKTK